MRGLIISIVLSHQTLFTIMLRSTIVRVVCCIIASSALRITTPRTQDELQKSLSYSRQYSCLVVLLLVLSYCRTKPLTPRHTQQMEGRPCLLQYTCHQPRKRYIQQHPSQATVRLLTRPHLCTAWQRSRSMTSLSRHLAHRPLVRAIVLEAGGHGLASKQGHGRRKSFLARTLGRKGQLQARSCELLRWAAVGGVPFLVLAAM